MKQLDTNWSSVVYVVFGVDQMFVNMVAGDLGQSFANGYLILANMLNTVTIDKLVVPELVQLGNVAILDCQYSVLDDRFTLQWLFNHTVVYEWRPGVRPKISGILEGQLDLDYKVSNVSTHEWRALRIAQVLPEMNGEYSCRVRCDAGAEAIRAGLMLVFSPEKEIVLMVHHDNNSDTLNIRCIARGLYPQPDLTLEYNQAPVTQQQRVWRSEALYCAESAARVRARGGRAVCRLLLPTAGYSAMRSRSVSVNEIQHGSSGASSAFKNSNLYISIILNIIMITGEHASRQH